MDSFLKFSCPLLLFMIVGLPVGLCVKCYSAGIYHPCEVSNEVYCCFLTHGGSSSCCSHAEYLRTYSSWDVVTRCWSYGFTSTCHHTKSHCCYTSRGLASDCCDEKQWLSTSSLYLMDRTSERIGAIAGGVAGGVIIIIMLIVIPIVACGAYPAQRRPGVVVPRVQALPQQIVQTPYYIAPPSYNVEPPPAYSAQVQPGAPPTGLQAGATPDSPQKY